MKRLIENPEAIAVLSTTFASVCWRHLVVLGNSCTLFEHITRIQYSALCVSVQRLHWDIGEQEFLELVDEQRHSEAVARLRALAAFEHQPPADSTSSVCAGLLALPPSSASSSSAALSNGAPASLPTPTPTPTASSSSSCAPAPAVAAGASQTASFVSASRATLPALNASVRHACTLQLARHARFSPMLHTILFTDVDSILFSPIDDT